MVCFHGDEVVQTNQGPMALHETTHVDDLSLLAWDQTSQQLVMSPVRYWLHAEEETDAVFVEVTTGTGRSLRLTGKHIIHRTEKCGGNEEQNRCV